MMEIALSILAIIAGTAGLTGIAAYKYYTKKIEDLQLEHWKALDYTWDQAYGAGEDFANCDPENVKKRYHELYSSNY